MKTLKAKHIGDVKLPLSLIEYVERTGARLMVEQTAFDAVNGYAMGIGTRVSIQRFAEFCPICGYHSIRRPNQKRLPGENRHRLERSWYTVFEWDDYGTDGIKLEEAFNEFDQAS